MLKSASSRVFLKLAECAELVNPFSNLITRGKLLFHIAPDKNKKTENYLTSITVSTEKLTALIGTTKNNSYKSKCEKNSLRCNKCTVAST